MPFPWTWAGMCMMTFDVVNIGGSPGCPGGGGALSVSIGVVPPPLSQWAVSYTSWRACVGTTLPLHCGLSTVQCTTKHGDGLLGRLLFFCCPVPTGATFSTPVVLPARHVNSNRAL